MKLSLLVGALATTAVVATGVVGVQYGITKYRTATPESVAIEQPILAENVEVPPEQTPASASTPAPARLVPLSGTYRCWSFNVGGAGKSCTSPPIVFNANGSYSMSSERGTYMVNGNTVVLSESKIRGPGTLLEDKRQIRFEYSYNGLAQTITYLKQE